MGQAIEGGGGGAKTAIKKCFCESKYQDKKYGQGKRVMNRTSNGDYRCTVCGKEAR